VAYDFAFALVNGGVLPELTYRAAVQEFGPHGAGRAFLPDRALLSGLGDVEHF
jgi:hypothetical protein